MDGAGGGVVWCPSLAAANHDRIARRASAGIGDADYASASPTCAHHRLLMELARICIADPAEAAARDSVMVAAAR